jgi:hypothetical protein
MSYLDFLRNTRLFEKSLHSFARNRVIPTDDDILSLLEGWENLREDQSAIIIAMADSLASLRKRAIDAGVNPKTMPVGYLEMLQWVIDPLKPIIKMIPQEKPEMRVVREKLETFRGSLKDKRDHVIFIGGEQGYKDALLKGIFLSHMTGMSREAAIGAMLQQAVNDALASAANTADTADP